MAVTIPKFCYYFMGNGNWKKSRNRICDLKPYYFCKYDEKCYTYEDMLIVLESGYLKDDFIEIPILHHSLSREFLKLNKIYSYHMKKVSEMTDSEVSSVCHWYCEENHLIQQWREYERKNLSDFAIDWCEENGILYSNKEYIDYLRK